MNDHQKYIEDYLSGILTTEDKLIFEKRLASEEGFKEAYEMEVASRKLVKLGGRRHLKARLEQFEAEPKAKIIRPFFSTKRLLLVASLIIGLTASFWLIQSAFGHQEHQELFAEHFQAYRSPVIERGETTTEKSDWESGIEDYNAQNYETAIPAFEAALSAKQAPEYLIHFYIGQCYLAKDKPDAAAAITAFKKVMGDNFYQQPAQWYMALAHLESGQTDKAIMLFKELARSKNYKEKEINLLLKSLEE